MIVDVRRAVPDVLLLIAGEGPAEGRISALIGSLGLHENVQLIGYMDRGQTLRACYRAADVFVFASRTETQGLVLLEAMAQGTPVVSTAVMGTADVLSGMEGATIAPDNEIAFARMTAELLQAHDRRAALGELAIADARSWASSSLAKRLLDLYASVAPHRARDTEAA